MNEDRTRDTLMGLAVFIGSIGGLFMVARLTHVAFSIAKHPERMSGEAWTQAGTAAIAVVVVLALAAAVRLLLAGRHDERLAHPGAHRSHRAV